MRDAILILVMVVFCIAASVFSTAKAKTNSIICNDSNSSVHIRFNTNNTDTILVNNEQYVFMESDSTGDIDRGWYRSTFGIMELEFHITKNSVSTIMAKGTAPNSSFKEGYCKLQKV